MNARAYLGASLLLSSLLSFSALLLAFPQGVLPAAVYSLLSLSLALLAFRHYPSILRARRALSIESDLPEALRSLASQLGMRLSFEQALGNLASSGYSCSGEFASISENINRGASVREALSASAESVDSITYKRVMSNLSSIYERGSDASLLKALADDLVSIQLSSARTFSSRLALASLLFIAAASIVPSMLLAYLLVGSSFLSLTVQPFEVWLLFPP